MKTQSVLNSILTTALALSMNSPAQAEDRGAIAPRPRPQVLEVAGLRLDLAASMIKALDANLVCDAEAYPSSINQEVTNAWYLASDRQKSAFLKKIPAKSIIRKDLAFRIAVGHVDLSRFASPEKFARAITGTRFFGFGLGVYGSRYNVTLGRDGVAHQQSMTVGDTEPSIRWHASKTTWSVEPNKSDSGERFVIKIGEKSYETDRSSSGEVRLIPHGVQKDTPEYFEQVRTSADSYCEV